MEEQKKGKKVVAIIKHKCRVCGAIVEEEANKAIFGGQYKISTHKNYFHKCEGQDYYNISDIIGFKFVQILD